MQRQQIIILGAGLAGLTLAYRLKQKGMHALVLEARGRTGGRIETFRKRKATLELGATWFADRHTHLNGLLNELKVEKISQDYGQYAVYEAANSQPVLYPVPPQAEVTYRIKGGSQVLTDRLAEKLDQDFIKLGEPVYSLDFTGREIEIHTARGTYLAELVINTLPPNLLVKSIRFTPELPRPFIEISQKTHTWMGESIKAGVISDKPFWKEKGIGTFYSQTGPFTEMYDHSNGEGFAVKGFLHDGMNELSDEERQRRALQQLSVVFGKAQVYESHFVQKAWREEAFTYALHTGEVFPHENNGHPILRESQFNGKLFMAGSETASTFPGYMDGAVEAANRVARQVSAIVHNVQV